MTSLLDKFTLKLNIDAFTSLNSYSGTMFHYTSSNNISSILFNDDNVTLWASRYDCLNDISEGTLPKIRFDEVCLQLKENGTISSEFYEIIKSIKTNQTDLIFPTIQHTTRPVRDTFITYITSFSEDDDALAMWNYYSKGSFYEGVNIGMRSQALIDSISSTVNGEGKLKIYVSKVIYDEMKQREIISKFVTELYSKYTPGDESSVRYHIAAALTSLKMIFKNKYFEYEKEIRLVVQVFDKFKSEMPVSYRNHAGYIIPYIKLQFDKSAICQITMGPINGDTQQRETQKAVVHEMLVAHDFYITEKYSQIPIRY